MGGRRGRHSCSRELTKTAIVILVAFLVVLVPNMEGASASLRASSLRGASLSVAEVEGTQATGLRYREPVFAEVSVRRGIFFKRARNAYGVDVDLYLDLYEPVGDTETARPLVVWAHGGWFALGTRGNGDVYEANLWARHGYTVASIDYRLDWDNGWLNYSNVLEGLDNPRFMTSWRNASDDIGSAIAFLRTNAGTFGIDPDAVFSSGHSAGGMASLHNAYLPDEPGPPRSRPQAVLPLSGTSVQLPQAGGPPSLMFHGTNDTIVPYWHAVEFCAAAPATGVECVMDSIANAPHFPFWLTDPMMARATTFQWERVLAPLGYTTETLPNPNGTITGSAKGRRGPLAGMVVVLARADRREIVTTTTSDSGGRFAFANVIPGQYKVAVIDQAHIDGAIDHYVPELYDNAGSTIEFYETATVVTVEAGGTTELNPIDLAHNNPGAISGRVYGDGAALGGMAHLIGSGDDKTLVGVVFSGSDGGFTVTDLPPGTYKLLTIDPAILVSAPSHYITEFYDDGGSTLDMLPSATIIVVSAGNETVLNPIVLQHTDG